MINGIIGKKVGMTQLFAEDGTVTPVTVIKAGPCVVVQTKSAAGKDGYNAVQIGLVEDRPVKLKNVNKPMRGHFEKTGAGTPPTRVLKELRLDAPTDELNVGDTVLVGMFADDVVVPTSESGLYMYLLLPSNGQVRVLSNFVRWAPELHAANAQSALAGQAVFVRVQ